MSGYFENLSVKTRVASLSALAIGALAAVVAIFVIANHQLSGAQAQAEHFAAIARADDDLHLATMEMRRSEKDFLLRRQTRYADSARKAVETAAAHLQRLVGLDSQGALRDDMAALRTGLAAYGKALDALVAAEVRKGLTPEDGQAGHLRGVIHKVEATIHRLENAAAMVQMLTMRRHEKDYMLRGDPAYLDKARVAHGELVAALRRLPLADKDLAAAEAEANDYLAALKDYVDADRAAKDAQMVLSDTFAAMVPAFDRVERYASDSEARELAELDRIRSRTVVLVVVLVASVSALVLLMALKVSRAIVGPVGAITAIMGRLAQGERGMSIPFTDRRNEIGEMARSVEVFHQGLIHAEQMDAEEAARQRAELERARQRAEATAAFDGEVTRILREVSGASDLLEEFASKLHASAGQTSDQSVAVASAAEESSANVQAVASAAEELGQSTQEISRRTQETRAISQDAVTSIDAASRMVGSLDEAASHIGQVVNLINAIAAQTNLLALNATIEAARAGEAGKGFAVVAGEVKSLATQTARATEEIQNQITSVQSNTKQVVATIGQVHAVVGSVDEVVAGIAAAVEQQAAATGEIAHNVEEAAAGNALVTGNIANVSRLAGQTGTMADRMHGIANDLGRDVDGLRAEIEGFLARMHAL